MENNDFHLFLGNYRNILSSRFNSLLKDKTLVDVTLAADGKYIKAHKVVLSVCSPFFMKLFKVNPCQHPIVIISNVDYNILCNLLTLMYQGEVSVKSEEEMVALIKVGKTLGIKGLNDDYCLIPASNEDVIVLDGEKSDDSERETSTSTPLSKINDKLQTTQLAGPYKKTCLKQLAS